METWRYIDSGSSDAALNMALDEAIVTLVRQDRLPPTLRMYSWISPSVSIGYFQRLSDINGDFCRKNSIPVVRRPTGGRAILHGEEITYSFSARTGSHPSFRTLPGSYSILSRCFFLAMQDIGLDITVKNRRERGKKLVRSPYCFGAVSFGEIVTGDIKVIGSAQKRYRDGFLQQGSIPFSIDRTLYQGIFHGSPQGYFAGLSVLAPDREKSALKEAIHRCFASVFQKEFAEDVVTEEEARLAREILKKKYSSLQQTVTR